MVSDSTYRAVWNGLLEVARARRYFAAQERKHRFPALALRFVLAFAGVASAASFLDWAPAWLASASGLVVIALITIDLVMNYPKRIAELGTISNQLFILENDYRRFWDDTRNSYLKDKEARLKNIELTKQLESIVSIVDLPQTEKLLKRAEEQADKVESQRYA